MVITVITIGYLIGLRKAQTAKYEGSGTTPVLNEDLKDFLFSFSLNITTVLLTDTLNVNLAIATLTGILSLSIIIKVKVNVFEKFQKIGLCGKSLWRLSWLYS